MGAFTGSAVLDGINARACISAFSVERPDVALSIKLRDVVFSFSKGGDE